MLEQYNKIFRMLENIANESNNRVEKYLSEMQEMLKDDPQWNSNKEKLFKEMRNEVKRNRYFAIASYIFIGLLILLIPFHEFYWEPKQKEILAERIREANLPLSFESDPSTKEMKAIYNIESINEQDKENLLKEAKLENVPLGRYPGIGIGIPLTIHRSKESINATNGKWEWNISPQERFDQVIGSLSITQKDGNLESIESPFKKPIHFSQLEHLYLQILKVNPTTWVDEDSTRKAIYSIQFGYKPTSDSKPIWSNEKINVEYSPDGKSFDGPYLISDSQWDVAYVVTIAIGYWGEKENTYYAHNIKSKARRINFNQ